MAESADPVPDEMSRQRLVARAAYTTGEEEEQEVAPEKTLCGGGSKNYVIDSQVYPLSKLNNLR